MNKLKLAVFASHGGSNMQSIIEASKSGNLAAEVVCIISNNSDSMALQRAINEGIPGIHISQKLFENESDYINEILKTLKLYSVDLIILAGYMKMIPLEIIKAYRNRILNIHPALLPKFGGKGMFGMNVHNAVIAAGETESGPTVHIVDEIYDNGKILLQRKIPVMPDDTPESLAERVLAEEHKIYAETIQLIIEGKITLD
ncbi:MAG: phosphoribosylglycinamide formyltransferase [Ignavibacteria bacterium GWF2_33_9]|nr:MAG: phosphoribosylglycinamide formyltransferase [Ignavibacteria bacterium GWF2_33_9]